MAKKRIFPKIINLYFRQSATPPVVKYVPVYPNADPRFISYNAGANYNLGNIAR